MRGYFFDLCVNEKREGRLLVPFIVVALSWSLSLTIRYTFGLDEMGLTIGEGIDEIVKVSLAIGLIWLFLRNVQPSPYKKGFSKRSALIDLSIGVIVVAIMFLYGFFFYSSLDYHYYSLGFFILGMEYAIIILFTIRHYRMGELGLFLKDLGLRMPSVRIIVCWAATIVLFFSLIRLSAGANFQAFLNDYYNTLFWMPNVLYMIFAWLGPEETFFRVYLQTRLERLMPVGWAIIIQSLLFSIIHIPGNAVNLGWGWSVVSHLANTSLLTNGLIGGYLWHRTKNLPILILYHWTK